MLFINVKLSFIVLFFWTFSVRMSKHKAFLRFHKAFHNQDINWNFKRYNDAKSWKKPSFFELTISYFAFCSTSLFQFKTIRKFKLKWRKDLINLTLFLLRFKALVVTAILRVLALDKLESQGKSVQYLYLYFDKFSIDIFPILYKNYFTFYEGYEMLQIVFNRVKTSGNTLIFVRLRLLLNRWSICSS